MLIQNEIFLLILTMLVKNVADDDKFTIIWHLNIACYIAQLLTDSAAKSLLLCVVKWQWPTLVCNLYISC